MYTSNQIADWILSKVNTTAGDTISPLKLQKLLYYCQAWHLTIFKKALFDEQIEAWTHGPVVSTQYARFAKIKMYNSILIENNNLDIPNIERESKELLDEVINLYGEHSASYLESLTHSESPWIEARKGLKDWERSTNTITHDSMISFYSEMTNGE